MGEILLRDSDTLWQIKIGQWIIEHGAVPYTDVHSFTRFGEPWMSSSWLSQVLYAMVLCVVGLGRAGYPDLARGRRDRCDLHVSARRTCRPGTFGIWSRWRC